MEASTIVVIFGFLILGSLALLNALDLRKERRAVRLSDHEARWFVGRELLRAWLRAAGWYLLFGALIGRVLTESFAWDVITVIVAAASVGSFFTDGVLGRFERRKILKRR